MKGFPRPCIAQREQDQAIEEALAATEQALEHVQAARRALDGHDSWAGWRDLERGERP